MTTPTIVFIICMILFVLLYNSLVAKKNQVSNIFASLDAQLKKRYDLLPNLVATLKEYMHHEKSLLEKITTLRVEAMKPTLSEEQKIQLDKQLTQTLERFMVTVENYPDLKANQNVLHLQQTLVEVEEQISAARRAYNQAVTDYNNALEQIPTNFIASLLHYTPKQVFEIPQEQRENLNMAQLFKNS